MKKTMTIGWIVLAAAWVAPLARGDEKPAAPVCAGTDGSAKKTKTAKTKVAVVDHAAQTVDIKITAADGSSRERKDTLKTNRDGSGESKTVIDARAVDGSTKESVRKVTRNADGSFSSQTESDVKTADGTTTTKLEKTLVKGSDGSTRARTEIKAELK